MKKAILLSSFLAIGATFADVTVPATQVGVMGVSMPKQAQLVAVPFLGYDVDAATISDLLNTAELGLGTKLYAPTGENQYNIWQLKTGEGGSKVWEKLEKEIVIDATGEAKDAETPGADVSTLSRGGAFWLEPVGTETDERFYILGRPTDEAGSSTLVSSKWNLVGNTSGEAKEVPNGVKGEVICVPDGNGKLLRYEYNTVANGWVLEGQRKTTAVSIPVGQGFWYLSKGTESISWQ